MPAFPPPARRGASLPSAREEVELQAREIARRYAGARASSSAAARTAYAPASIVAACSREVAHAFRRPHGGFGKRARSSRHIDVPRRLLHAACSRATTTVEDASNARRCAGMRGTAESGPPRRRLPSLLDRRALARPALREDALRQRAPRAPLHRSVPRLRRRGIRRHGERHRHVSASRDAEPRGRLFRFARRRLGGRRGQVLRVDPGRGERSPRRRPARPRRRTPLLRRHARRELRRGRANVLSETGRSPAVASAIGQPLAEVDALTRAIVKMLAVRERERKPSATRRSSRAGTAS